MFETATKLTGIALLKHIIDTWNPFDLNPVTVRFKDLWPILDEYDSLTAEVARLRAELDAIANSEPLGRIQCDWYTEWQYLRSRAQTAVNHNHDLPG